VLADSRQQRTWLRPSRGEVLEARLVQDEPLALSRFRSSLMQATGTMADPTDLADATVSQDLRARGVYRVTLRFRRTGVGRLFVRLGTANTPTSRVLRSFRANRQQAAPQSDGVRLVVPGATCDASLGLVRDEATQLVCVCAAGYFEQAGKCRSCPVGTSKSSGGNLTSCPTCQSG